MQVLGQFNGIAHHERNKTSETMDYPTVTAEWRRRIIATLIGHDDWTTSSIAQALDVSESVVNADLRQIGLDGPVPAASLSDFAKPLTDKAALVRDGSGRFITETSSESSPLLEAYRSAEGGLTASEASDATGLTPQVASKRISRLRKRGLLKTLVDESGAAVWRDGRTVYAIVE